MRPELKAPLLQRVREAVLPQNAFRRALDEGDVASLWRLWGRLFPQAYQPADWQEAEVQMHVARTGARSCADRLRCYSHHWLRERGLPSPLPEDLREEAERVRPTIALGVGFSWNAKSAILQPAKPLIMDAVAARIEEMAADGMLASDPDGVRREMILAKNRELYSLFGNTSKLQGEPA